MNKKLWLLAGIFIFGLVVLLLPDRGTAVVRLNEEHGPSWMDLTGLLSMLIGWAGLSYRIVKNWRHILQIIGVANARVLTAIYFIAILAIIISLVVAVEWMLWISIAIASIVNFFFFIITCLRRSDKKSRSIPANQ